MNRDGFGGENDPAGAASPYVNQRGVQRNDHGSAETPSAEPSLFLDDGDVRLYHGDALEVLQGLPAESVHMCVTSPPFYGLRNYGVTGQIGLEETPEQWVESLVRVFREVRRILRPEGTLWLEIGDSYASSSLQEDSGRGLPPGSLPDPLLELRQREASTGALSALSSGLKAKDLIGAPWLLAFALRADGWYLRSDIVWSRPNPMPESVTDRPTKSHSYVFLLSKQPRYFFDQEAVRESNTGHAQGTKGVGEWNKLPVETTNGRGASTLHSQLEAGRNVRSVWTIPTQPFSASALPGGVRHKASPDCPMHGDRAALVAMGHGGERGETPSPRTQRTGNRHGQEPLTEPVPTGPPPEQGSAPASSDSPDPDSSRPANARSTQNHKTASYSTEGGTASGETADRRPSSGQAYVPLVPDGSASPERSETADGTSDRCTCNPASIDHFATFPEELARRCILAGSSERGCCPECGAPWVREVELGEYVKTGASGNTRPTTTGDADQGQRRARDGHISGMQRVRTALGWRPSCSCALSEREAGNVWPAKSANQSRCLAPPAPRAHPCVVLDPFVGSGTVPHVARKHGRHAIGIDLNQGYLELAARRLQQLSLFAQVAP